MRVTAPEYVWVPVVVTEPCMLEVPETIKLEVPAVLLMVPSRSKVATVKSACRSKVPELPITRSVALLRLPVSLTVPALMVVSPV